MYHNCKPIDVIMDGNGDAHILTRFAVVQTGSKQNRRARVQQCSECEKQQCFVMNVVCRIVIQEEIMDMDANVFSVFFQQGHVCESIHHLKNW